MKPATRLPTEPAPLEPPPAVTVRTEPAPLAPAPAAVRTEPAPLAPPPAFAPGTEPVTTPAFAPGTEPATTPRAGSRAFSELATEVRPPDAIATAPTATAAGIAPAPVGGNDVPIEEWSVPVESAHGATASPSTTARGFAAAPTTTAPGVAPAPAPSPGNGRAPSPAGASRPDTGFRAETPAPLPAPPVVPAPLPAPPVVASANGSGSLPSTAAGTDALHPRAPSDWIADRVPDARAPNANIARRDPSAVDDDVLVAAPLRVGSRNKKLIAFAGGGVLLLVIIVFAATRGGGGNTAAHADKPLGSAESVAAAVEPAVGSATGEESDATGSPMKPQPHHGGGTAAIATPTATGSAETVAAPHVETPTEPPREVEPPRKHPTLGGKKVVLEYDTPTHETPKSSTAAPDEESGVAKARAAYSAGNKRLFAGDAEGAVKAYQQALADYPGYVAGYRGLGLAYTQMGDKLKAMSAFHLYLSAVPGAKDAPLIKKRLYALSH